jgi:hypothetical protein
MCVRERKRLIVLELDAGTTKDFAKDFSIERVKQSNKSQFGLRGVQKRKSPL